MSELRKELLQGLDYYAHWEREAAHREQVEGQRFIQHEIEGNGYSVLARNGELIELGKLVATQHMHGWLKLHVLPKIAEIDKLEAEVSQWKNAHKSVVAAKRQLSAKYGAIMARKLAARWRRTKKRLRRCVTRITHKLRNRW